MPPFLPVHPSELRGPLDVLLVSGDAYVDHPAWGVAVVGRVLQDLGYGVAIAAQPRWDSEADWKRWPRPRLFAGISSGNMDSMVSRYTAARHKRDDDAYSPGGRVDLRPDRALIPYTARVRQAFPGLPVVLGGVEASLRRLVHYDYWQDRIRGSILLDAKADLLVFGMGERAIAEVARILAAGGSVRDCRELPGVAWAAGAKAGLPGGALELPSLERCRAEPRALGEVAIAMVKESNPWSGRPLVQRHGSRAVVQNRPAEPLADEDLDRVYELPWQYAAHPSYEQPIPALSTVRGSVVVNRGCAGGCRFCALTAHQGKVVTSRTIDSVLREVQARPDVQGVLTDLGGPTANMFRMGCSSEEARRACKRRSCLVPRRCPHYRVDHGPYRDLLRQVRALPGIRHAYVNSGIRHDLVAEDPDFLAELVAHHVQGQLSIAPEHVADAVLEMMGKPGGHSFTRFLEAFGKAVQDTGVQRYPVPYLLLGHPGAGPEESVELALYLQQHDLRPRQVQLYIPTPSTASTAAWVSGVDPWSGVEVYVARGHKDRARQRALAFYWQKQSWPQVREALRAFKRSDLIGRGKLVPDGPAWGSWEKRRNRRQR